jgi:hypothetical protein
LTIICPNMPVFQHSMPVVRDGILEHHHTFNKL